MMLVIACTYEICIYFGFACITRSCARGPSNEKNPFPFVKQILWGLQAGGEHGEFEAKDGFRSKKLNSNPSHIIACISERINWIQACNLTGIEPVIYDATFTSPALASLY